MLLSFIGIERVYAADLELKVVTNFVNEPIIYERWNKIEVTITNKGDRDFAGSVILDYRSKVIQEVFIQSGKKVTLDFSLPPNFLDSSYNDVVIQVVDSRGREVTKRNLSVMWNPSTEKVGIIGSRVERYNLLKTLGRESLVTLKGEDFNNFLPLQNFSMIVIDDSKDFNLTGAHKENIELWVKRGGTLVIGANNTGFDFLPYRVTGSEIKEIDLFDVTEEVLYLKGEPLGDVLLEHDGLPILVKKDLGRGTVIFSAIPLTDNVFTKPQFFTGFWSYILPNTSENHLQNNIYRLGLLRDLRNVFSKGDFNLTFLKPGFLALGLIIYILVIGPLNFYLLRKWKKWDFGWLTVPLLAIFFTTSLFIIGSTGRSKEIVDTQVSIIEYLDENQAFVDSYISIFLPSSREKRVEVEDGLTLTPLTNGISLVNNKYFDLSEGRIWSNQRVHVTKVVNKKAPVVSVDIFHYKKEVVVENKSEADYFASFIQIGGEWHSLGEIKGGEKKSYTLTSGTRNIDYNFLFQRYNSPNRWMFSEIGERLAEGMVTFIAFEDTLSPVTIRQSKGTEGLNIYLLYQNAINVDYREITGIRNLPGVVTKVKAADYTKWGNAHFVRGDGEVEVVFTLPSGLDYSGNGLVLSTELYHYGNVKLQILDIQGEWKELSLGGMVNLGKAENYLLGNVVKVKLLVSQGASVDINPHSFKLSVVGGGQ